MGTCNFRSETKDLNELNITNISINLFRFNYPIGKGGFGKVWKIEHKKNKRAYALKEMDKARIIKKRSVDSIMNERRLLAMIRHPFIVNMQFACQDREKLYLAMDLMLGGDLRFHLSQQRKFSETQTRFFISCILCSLEYLHDNSIIHRDIKPENLVLDYNGYVHLTDFGISRIWQPANKNETSGTPGYMAPEVICRQNHNVYADYFALGVIAYEFMIGKRPYLGKNRKDIRDQILSKQVQIKLSDIPIGWSAEACDFTNRLLQRKPQNRLGGKGFQEIKKHPWLININWDELIQKQAVAPFIPTQKDNFDPKHVASEWIDEGEAVDLELPLVQKLFIGYYYDASSEIT